MKIVGALEYREYLMNGTVAIGDIAYEQDWDKILMELGYGREKYTYKTRCIATLKEDEFVTLNELMIYEKEEV